MPPSSSPLLVFIAGILNFALFIFQLMLWAYLIVSIVRNVRPDWRPTGAMLLILDVVFTVVEKPLRFIRRFIPPLDLGGIRLDLAWIILYFATVILGGFIRNIPYVF